MVAKALMVLGFFAIAIGVGVYCRRTTSSVEGFVLGGRNVGPWFSAFAYGTSYFSAVIFIGYAGQFGWKFGVAALWIGLGNAFIGSLLAWWILGPRSREMTHRIGATTMPEFFGKRYKSRSLRIASALIIFVFLIPYTASVYNGLSRLFGMAFGVPYEACVLAMAIITCLYVVVGGYMATVTNDFLQGCVMLLGITGVVFVVLNNNGGFTQAMITMSQIPAEGSEMQGAFISIFGPNPLDLLGVVILTSLGTWGLPQMVQKFYAIRSGSAIKQGAIISTFFALIVAGGSYFLGGFGRLYGDQIAMSANGTPIYDSIIPTMLSTLPDLIIGLVAVLVLSASMSTLSSLVLTSSSTLTLDVIKRNIVKDMSEKRQIWTMRVFLIVFVAVSAILALVQYHSSITFIAQLMGISWGALSGAFLGPFLWGLYSSRVSKAAVWASFIVGVGLTSGNMLMGMVGLTPLIASPINCGALAMVLSIVLVPLVSLFTKPVEFDIEPPKPESATDRELSAKIGSNDEQPLPAEAGIDTMVD